MGLMHCSCWAKAAAAVEESSVNLSRLDCTVNGARGWVPALAASPHWFALALAPEIYFPPAFSHYAFQFMRVFQPWELSFLSSEKDPPETREKNNSCLTPTLSHLPDLHPYPVLTSCSVLKRSARSGPYSSTRKGFPGWVRTPLGIFLLIKRA